MSKISMKALCALSIAWISIASDARADNDAPKSPPLHVPAGFILIEEDQWYLMADEPDRHLGRAREAFLMMDARTAAAELRKAGIHLRIAGAHATDRTKRSLVHAERELDQLARRLEAGTVRSVEEVDTATARALHALADYQYVKAAEAWRKREARVSGQYLRAAVDNLERSAARTDARIRATSAEVARESRLISGKLIEGTGFVIDEVGTGIEAVGREIEHVGTSLTPTRVVK